MPYIFLSFISYANIIFILFYFERHGHMQFKIKFYFLKKDFFIVFLGRKLIYLIPKKHLTRRSQFHLSNMGG